jgi:hypothetical protein
MRLPSCEPARGREALLVVMPRPVAPLAIDSGGPARRPSQVVVLMLRRCSSADKGEGISR